MTKNFYQTNLLNIWIIFFRIERKTATNVPSFNKKSSVWLEKRKTTVERTSKQSRREENHLHLTKEKDASKSINQVTTCTQFRLQVEQFKSRDRFARPLGQLTHSIPFWPQRIDIQWPKATGKLERQTGRRTKEGETGEKWVLSWPNCAIGKLLFHWCSGKRGQVPFVRFGWMLFVETYNITVNITPCWCACRWEMFRSIPL